MDSAAHTVAMLLADARLPSGGHAFSAGVEPAIQGGLARRRRRRVPAGPGADDDARRMRRRRSSRDGPA